jgi:heme o synthase
MGKIAPGDALGFGTVLSVASVIVMGLAVNMVAAAILALTIGFYVFIYTMWLKRRTSQNIVIGGAAGAFPPMIGWAAVTGDVSVLSIAMFAIIFLWTPPHFWALALYRSADYAAAGVPMLPNVAGVRETTKQIVLYTLLLLPASAAPFALGAATIVYGVGATLLSLAFVALAVRVWFDPSDRKAKQLFGFSIAYLFVLFGMLMADHLLAPLFIQGAGL